MPRSDPPHRPALLIVDDDPDVLRALAFMADTQGYDVRRCASARDALDTIDQPFACLVIAQNLPDLNGLELLHELRACGVRSPAVLVTNSPSAAVRKQAAAAGVPVVEKPLLDEELLIQIRRLTTA